MHEEDRGLDPYTIAKDRKAAEVLERENALEMIELDVLEALKPAQPKPARLPEYPVKPEQTGEPSKLRRFGRGVLRFFTKEEFLFLRFRELPNNSLPDTPGEPSHG